MAIISVTTYMQIFCYYVTLGSFMYIALFYENYVCLNRDVSILRALDGAQSAD